MIDKSVYSPGEKIVVTFTARKNFPQNAWIGIIPSNIEHGSEATNDAHDIAYQYIDKRTSGTMIFKAPASPGKYDIRMNNSDDNGKEVAYVSFKVR